ncbi:MAG: DUF4097 family beta strand repeat-containing protein [Holophagales bacterium]|jgi:DUF4097 and DUF4098 domain-containing protein YvlB|nr:DUF4097 family beta strand repeat-containing protein [Holophagales bacterium]
MLLRLAIPILVACIAIPLTAQTITIQPSAPGPVTETRTFALQSGGSLKIDWKNGDISVSSWDNDEVALKADFTPTIYGKIHSKVEIKSDVNSLKLTVEHPEKTEIGYVKLELKVPSHIAASDIKTQIGAIALEEITGKINAKTQHGDIDLKNVSGNINASTQFGNVKGNIQSIDDNLDASTQFGNVRLKLLNPNGALEASTQYGSIRIPPGARDIEAEKGNDRCVIKARYGGNAMMRFSAQHGSVVIQ